MATTLKDLDARITNVNRRLRQSKSIYRWQLNQRNGATAIDRYRNDSCVEMIFMGTKGEVAHYLSTAMVAIDDANTIQ